MEDDLSQKMHGNIMFSVCLVKMEFLFPANMKLPFSQKGKHDLFAKNSPKDDIFGINEKDDIYLRKDDVGILDWHSRKKEF